MLAADWNSIFTAVAAVAAAVAAIAAWAAVLVETRARARDREPLLTIGLTRILDEGSRVRIAIDNSGGGMARDVRFVVYDGEVACMGGLPPAGTLGRDRRVVLATQLTGSDDAYAVVTCRWGRYLMGWDASGRQHRIKLKDNAAVRPADMWSHFYPEVPAVDRLSPVLYSLEFENI